MSVKARNGRILATFELRAWARTPQAPPMTSRTKAAPYSSPTPMPTESPEPKWSRTPGRKTKRRRRSQSPRLAGTCSSSRGQSTRNEVLPLRWWHRTPGGTLFGVMSREFAAHFADEWIAAWSAQDLPRILSHYEDDFEMASPRIIEIAGQPSGVLRGKKDVGAYWAKALALVPDLRFELLGLFLGRPHDRDPLPKSSGSTRRRNVRDRHQRTCRSRIRPLRLMVIPNG